ncbi:hypothetical protein CEP51_011898 [Fusarium floridanum]|uniref:Uncharacterized protein n=1 Tax=Fusarium floridanum TaxID=1325733 RepID=A0A428R4N9_9HYPO|nr:hypothetical protein CEP51_011898 [Fusarium floridanum]
MNSQPQHHDTSGFCPPATTSRPLGAIKEQLRGTRDDDTVNTASHPSNDVQLDQATGNNHEYGPEDQEPFDDWTAEEIFQVQQENYQAFIEEVRATNAKERLLSNELMTQNMSIFFGQGFQQMMNFLTKWSKRFSQHHLVNKVAALEEQLDLANQKNQQLGQEYKEMRARHNKVCTKLDQALHERDEQRRLVDGGTLANSSKVTDDAIMEKWKLLAYNIRVLAHFLAKSPPGQQFDTVSKARLEWISLSYLDHLQDEDYREVLLQGYLWSTVNETVFDAGTRVWGGPGIADLKTIQNNIIGKYRITPQDAQEHREICQHAARWLAQGSGILNQLWDLEPEGVKVLVNIETSRLMTFLPAQNTDPNGMKKVRDQIGVIIECAVELDQMLMCSKALFQVHWKDQVQGSSKPQRFNPSTMESYWSEKELPSESLVQMVISPFLSKAGNADGQNYECSMVLAKATVICD